MKKLLLFFSLSVSLLVVAKAAVQPPVDQRGNALTTTEFVGAIPCVINGANEPPNSSAAPIVCGSSTTATRSVVYGIIASSLTASQYLVFRDTVPGGVGGISGVNASTVAVIYNYDVTTSTTLGNAQAGTHFIKFPVPLQFLKGIAVNTDAIFGGSVSSWTILYRPLAATE